MEVRSARLEAIQMYVNRLEAMSAYAFKIQRLPLYQVFEHAVLTDVLPRNPVQGVQPPPSMTHNTKGVCPYEKDDQRRLVAAFAEEKNGRPGFRYVLMMETGLGTGEALALKWGGIDEEKRTQKVSKSPMRADGKNTVRRTTKTASGRRTIPLNNRALEAIQPLKDRQVSGCPYVFAAQTGKYLSYRNLLATMEKACEAVGQGTGACTRYGICSLLIGTPGG